MLLYHWYELSHAAIKPARLVSEASRLILGNPFNPWSHTHVGRHISAVCEVFERITRRYEKPTFGLDKTHADGRDVAVREAVVWRKPFCKLVHFERDLPAQTRAKDPKVLLVAPMSGHYATLLRGTVETLLPNHEVYITDWQDARDVPLAAGFFDLDDYIDYVIEMIRIFEGDVHVFAVCQPSVPVLAATAVMEDAGDPFVPRSVTLAGGPVDTRVSPTKVNDLAEQKGTDWFRRHVISVVPWSNPGAGRAVYPGFLQLTGFMTMNLDRHVDAHKNLFFNLVRGDGDSAEKHRTFYDEYLAVMDLTAEFYLQTIDTVFVKHALPKGTFTHRGQRVDIGQIRNTALMTIEGEKDDITGLGQCRAALDLAVNLDDAKKLHITAPKVGHYGIFNGSRFRNEIAPRIAQFMRTHDPRAELISVTLPRHHGANGFAGGGDAGHAGRSPSPALKGPSPHAAEPAHEADAFTFGGGALPTGQTAFKPAGGARSAERSTQSSRSERPTSSSAGSSSPDAFTPLRFWSLAGRMMMGGMFGSPARG